MENKNMYQKEYANEMKWDNTTLSLITKYGTLKPPSQTQYVIIVCTIVCSA